MSKIPGGYIRIPSGDPVAAQLAYHSIWYTNVYTANPINPHGFTDSVVSEQYDRGSDHDGNGSTTNQAGNSTRADGEKLANTGNNLTLWIAGSFTLITAGGVVVVVRRRL